MMAKFIIGGAVLFIMVLAFFLFCSKKSHAARELYLLKSTEDIVTLFPKDPSAIPSQLKVYMDEVSKGIESIIAIPDENRTYQNTAGALDELAGISNFAMYSNTLAILEMVCPDATMRKVCHEQVIIAKNFVIDQITNNVALYRAYKAYADGNAKKENLSDEQRYFLARWFSLGNTMVEFKLTGLDLPHEQREQAKKVNKEIEALKSEFSKNINDDTPSLTFTKQELAGLEDDFIGNLKQGSDALYVIDLHFPAYIHVMKHCAVEMTRKKCMQAFLNRAYPVNDQVLKNLIAKRDEFAKVMGFESFAQLDLANEMVQTPERAYSFLKDVAEKAEKKADKEFAMLKDDLPDGIALTADGKFKSWDRAYIIEQYKKKKFNLNELEVAHYFPMEKTVAGLLSIYEQFLSLKFKEIRVNGLWHEDVKVIESYDAHTNEFLGYLVLDLYPRPNKYGHACQIDIVPAIVDKNGNKPPMMALVIANFPKSTPTAPSLLKHADVVTFFHEFGHAMHTMFGRLSIIALAGARTKQDFVELPSQMLEEWVWDKQMLKKISGHYKTGEPLPDQMIDSMIELKRLNSGGFVITQILYSLLSLDCFATGADKDPWKILERLSLRMYKHTEFNEQDHMYASFGHLTGYGAKYYGYLWSRVFALDLFEYIKERGLLNKEVGNRYITEIISKGGAQDSNSMLKNFLGREPNQDAFLKDMGL